MIFRTAFGSDNSHVLTGSLPESVLKKRASRGWFDLLHSVPNLVRESNGDVESTEELLAGGGADGDDGGVF